MPSYTGVNRNQYEPGRCEICLTYIWNREKGTFLGRKIGHWAILLLFYIVFVACILGLLFLLTWITVSVVTRYPQAQSQVGSNPDGFGSFLMVQPESNHIDVRVEFAERGTAAATGCCPAVVRCPLPNQNQRLGFRPLLSLTSPLIWYKWNEDEMSYGEYVREIDRFFRVYRQYDESEYTDCKEEVLPMERSEPCFFNVKDLGDCASPTYGYEDLAPCVFVKLNKMHGWSPKSYNETSNLPSDMPTYLQKYITENMKDDVKKMNTVWLSCEGYYPADTQHMGEITMFPRYGFQAAHFPYLGQKAYVPPLVAIKFKAPSRDTLITVQCRAWAHNIDSSATIEFQLMVGSKD